MTKILLIEDNEMNRDMLSRRLRRRGYDVAVAVDGEQGIAMACSERPAGASRAAAARCSAKSSSR